MGALCCLPSTSHPGTRRAAVRLGTQGAGMPAQRGVRPAFSLAALHPSGLGDTLTCSSVASFPQDASALGLPRGEQRPSVFLLLICLHLPSPRSPRLGCTRKIPGWIPSAPYLMDTEASPPDLISFSSPHKGTGFSHHPVVGEGFHVWRTHSHLFHRVP